MATAGRKANSLGASPTAVNALKGDYAAITFLLIAQKQKVCSGLMMGKIMVTTEYAWKEDGKLEPSDMVRLGLVSIENNIDGTKEKDMIRIMPEGERVAGALLSSGDDRIKEIKTAIDVTANLAETHAFNQMYLYLVNENNDYLMMLLTAKLQPGIPLAAPLRQMEEGPREVLLTVIDLGLIETHTKTDGPRLLKLNLTELGERVIEDLKKYGYAKLIESISNDINEIVDKRERLESFGTMNIRGETRLIN